MPPPLVAMIALISGAPHWRPLAAVAASPPAARVGRLGDVAGAASAANPRDALFALSLVTWLSGGMTHGGGTKRGRRAASIAYAENRRHDVRRACRRASAGALE